MNTFTTEDDWIGTLYHLTSNTGAAFCWVKFENMKGLKWLQRWSSELHFGSLQGAVTHNSGRVRFCFPCHCFHFLTVPQLLLMEVTFRRRRSKGNWYWREIEPFLCSTHLPPCSSFTRVIWACFSLNCTEKRRNRGNCRYAEAVLRRMDTGKRYQSYAWTV